MGDEDCGQEQKRGEERRGERDADQLVMLYFERIDNHCHDEGDKREGPVIVVVAWHGIKDCPDAIVAACGLCMHSD